MKRIGMLLAVLVVAAWSARGDETPQMQLDFVRKLRDKGYVDLALEYLEAWQKKAPPEMKTILPMEMARTRIALARDKPPDQRLALIKAARTELETFVKSYADKPEGVQARLELARLDTQAGKAVLSKALRQEDIKTQQSEAKAAEALFIRAGQELDAAAKLLAALSANYKNPDPKLRSRPIVGLQFMNNFVYAGRNVWDGGKIYDPESGKTYKCKMTLQSTNRLEVHGYVGVSLLGRTVVWTR